MGNVLKHFTNYIIIIYFQIFQFNVGLIPLPKHRSKPGSYLKGPLDLGYQIESEIYAYFQQEVDVAVGPLMFSPKRQEDVRFSRPYMEDYNGILMSRSIDQPGQEARVFAPFASSVWLAIIGATISAGLLLHVTQVCHVWRTARRTTGTETRPIGLRLAERSPTQSDGPPFEDHDDKNFTDMAECSSSAQNSSHASNSALKHASDDDSQPIFHINSQSLTSSRCLRTCSGDDVTCSDQNRRRSGTKQNAVAYTEGKTPTEVPEEVGLRKPEVGSSIWAIYAMYLEQGRQNTCAPPII